MVDDSFYQILEKSLNKFFIQAHYNINWEWPRWKSYYKIFAEPECMCILNGYFWYNFNMCDKVNQKAIDWYDSNKDIWIQVTNRTDKTEKFKKDTINEADKLIDYPNLKKLKFFVLQLKWNTYTKWNDLNKSISNGDKFDFNNSEDIITFDTIIKNITSETDLLRIKKFMSILITLFPKEDWVSDYNDLIINWERQNIVMSNIIDWISSNKNEII